MENLTTTQKQSIKTWVQNNNSSKFDQSSVDLLNAAASPDYWMWDTVVSKAKVRAAVVLESYTPVDAVPASPSTDLTYSNRAFICQLKQANAMFLVQGENGTLDASSGNLRKSFQDCMRQIPSGTDGAIQDGGWGAPASPGAVRLAMQSKATVAEKLLAVVATGAGNDGSTRGTTTNPDNYGANAKGPVTLQNVIDSESA